MSRLVRSFFLSGASAGEDVHESIVSLVASILENRTAGFPNERFARPGLGPGTGVIDGEAVNNGVVVDAREALDDMQLAGWRRCPGER